MTKEERDKLLLEYIRINEERVSGIRQKTLSSEADSELNRTAKKLSAAYFAGLPRIPLSKCPHTGQPLVKAFDPWGVDGFWWQEGEAGSCSEPPAPPTFAVLTGALNLAGKPPLGGKTADAHVGPPMPFVIPRILDMPDMIAVISCLSMACGYKAYPIAYFTTTKPAPGTLTSTWRRTSYGWVDETGDPATSYPTDPWDFELGPWIDRGKVQWIAPDDSTLQLQSGTAAKCPYVGMEGRHMRQIIRADKLKLEPPPNGEEINPFGD